jgi:hypothetical protein
MEAPVVTKQRTIESGTAVRHAQPVAADRCDLWVSLRTRDAGSHATLELSAGVPPLFLHFRASGLLLALPDEDPAILDVEAGRAAIRVDASQALGLGLSLADFANGVGLCGGAAHGELDGWRCRDVAVVGLDGEGRERPLASPHDVAAWLV